MAFPFAFFLLGRIVGTGSTHKGSSFLFQGFTKLMPKILILILQSFNDDPQCPIIGYDSVTPPAPRAGSATLSYLLT